ncbi:unnamed protein product, partial [Ectocarpus fasciculatus]
GTKSFRGKGRAEGALQQPPAIRARHAAGDTVQYNMVGSKGEAHGSHLRNQLNDTNQHIVSIGRASFLFVRRRFQTLRSAAKKARKCLLLL